jgi:hypothetical protein
MENQIVEEYKKNNDNKLQNLLSNVSVVHLLMLGVVALIVYSVLKNNTDPKINYIIYGVMGIIILVLYFRPNKEKKLLPDYIVKQIAQEALNKKVREGKEFAFNSKVFVTPYCTLKYENDMTTGTSGPTSWEIGFEELIQGSQYKKAGIIRIHPFEGFVCGIKHLPFGYTGRETTDKVDIVPVGVVQGNVKTSDWGNPPIK